MRLSKYDQEKRLEDAVAVMLWLSSEWAKPYTYTTAEIVSAVAVMAGAPRSRRLSLARQQGVLSGLAKAQGIAWAMVEDCNKFDTATVSKAIEGLAATFYAYAQPSTDRIPNIVSTGQAFLAAAEPEASSAWKMEDAALFLATASKAITLLLRAVESGVERTLASELASKARPVNSPAMFKPDYNEVAGAALNSQLSKAEAARMGVDELLWPWGDE